MGNRNVNSIVVKSEAGDELKKIAVNLGYFYGDKPNLRELVEAIACGEISLIEPAKHEKLEDIIRVLRSEQKHVAATQLELLFGMTSNAPFVEKIILFIQDKIPFRFSYQDAAGKSSQYDCTYAEMRIIEGKEYLYVYFDGRIGEVMDSEEMPGLARNRCFRIDRIPQSASVHKIPHLLKWREEGLQTMSVKFALSGNLAHAYTGEESDVVEWQGEQLIITRQVISDFWFMRQMMRYGKHCTILEPSDLREKAIANLEKTLNNYI